MRAVIIAGCFALAGCNPVPKDWQTAAEDYDCTVDQMEIVDRETRNCVENTDYIGRYCYGQAIMRRCEKKAPETPNE